MHDDQCDDNPLWYDYVEPDEPPSRMLLALAGVFSFTVRVTATSTQLCRLPGRLWRRTSHALANLQKTH